MRINDEYFSRDLYANSLVIIAALFVIALLLINPPAKESDMKPLGNIVITMAWPPGPDDIDLWVLGPDEQHAVGYSAKSGRSLNLLRDDLGTAGDTTPVNLEIVVSRGIIAGEYIINAHAYRASTLPIVVDVEVSVNDGVDNSPTRRIAGGKVTLTNNGQEKTVARFRLDEAGNIVPGSVNSIFVPLREAR